MLWTVSLLVLGAGSLCSASVPNAGTCIGNVKTQPNFDFDKYHTENGGNWNIVFGPNTTTFESLSSLTVKITPIGNHQYKETILYSTKYGQKGQMPDEVITYDGNGVLSATGADGTVLKSFVLQYVPGRYAFYYTCAGDGADKKTDYRYVLAHEPLSMEEVKKVLDLDRSLGFKGSLIPIGMWSGYKGKPGHQHPVHPRPYPIPPQPVRPLPGGPLPGRPYPEHPQPGRRPLPVHRRRRPVRPLPEHPQPVHPVPVNAK